MIVIYTQSWTYMFQTLKALDLCSHWNTKGKRFDHQPSIIEQHLNFKAILKVETSRLTHLENGVMDPLGDINRPFYTPLRAPKLA